MSLLKSRRRKSRANSVPIGNSQASVVAVKDDGVRVPLPLPAPDETHIASAPKMPSTGQVIKTLAKLPPKYKKLPADSKVRKTALLIKAMKLNGMSDEEIGAALDISPKTLKGYMYLAGKHGWLDPYDPEDKLKYEVMHKAVKNLDELLDSDVLPIKKDVTMRTLEGTIFKGYDQATIAQLPNMNVLSVKVEFPSGVGVVEQVSRADGVPAYIDAEVVNGGNGQ